MATGSGKTRTVIALIDQLMRANWTKRALFLADRVALVNQAVGAFKTHMPSAAPVNLVTEKQTEGRLYVSTYPTMMGLIDEVQNGVRRFGSGHFDPIVIDEVHRSVYREYRAIFDYFDSLKSFVPGEKLDPSFLYFRRRRFLPSAHKNFAPFACAPSLRHSALTNASTRQEGCFWRAPPHSMPHEGKVPASQEAEGLRAYRPVNTRRSAGHRTKRCPFRRRRSW
jgi:type III restriction/modification enzyme restriction subunit